MIRPDPTLVDAPPILTDAKAAGATERKKAADSLKAWLDANKDPAKWKFAFAVYSHADVKRQLERLFHGKCAYCESFYGATQPMDVEHWRPKGRVDDGAGNRRQPGYYWLAASWDNLLPSCIDCNRRRTQTDALTKKERSIGKQDQFPLAPGSPAATKPGEEGAEVPLLLNPRVDDPSVFLTFTDEALATPTSTDGDLAEQRARSSIDVYALNRVGLVQARQEHLRLAKLRMVRIGLLIDALDDPTLSERVQLLLDDLLSSEVVELARLRNDEQPYALLARAHIDEWVRALVADGKVPPAAFATSGTPGRMV